MSDQLVLNDPEIGRILAKKANVDYGDLSTCIARVRDDRILGGVVYSGFTGESIQMHVASFVPRWANRDGTWMAFHYPFVQLGVKRVFGQVPEDNLAAQTYNLNLGFEIVTRIEGVYRGGLACILMKMEKADCRFLKWTPRHVKSNVLEDV